MGDCMATSWNRISAFASKLLKVSCIYVLFTSFVFAEVVPLPTPLPLPPVTTAPTTLPTVNPTTGIQKTLMLKNINSKNGVFLKGAIANQVIFLPVLHDWNIHGIQVHLNVYSAALSNSTNTLTAYVNDSPISSVQLKGFVNNGTPWDFIIPANLLNDKAVNLTLKNEVSDYGFNCYNLANPKYWIFISGTSTITYNYTLKKYAPNLSKFPYPFINDPSLDKDVIVMAFADKISLADYTAAFNVTNALQQEASWRGMKVIVTTVSQLTDAQKKNNNIIIIGTSKELPFSSLPIKWPLNIANVINDKNNQKINEDTGILMLAASPWNPNHGILAITGNSEKALIKAAGSLRDPNFVNTVLFNEYALIEQSFNNTRYRSLWTDATLQDLNFTNQVVFGNGENTINYDINLPEDKTIKALDLTVDYSISPFLSTTEDSYLTLRVNDTPLTGIILKPNKDSLQKWKVHIEGKNLQPGANHLVFIFNMNMKNKFCKPQDSTLAWGSILNTTALSLTFEKTSPFLKFRQLRASDRNLVISLPANNDYFSSVQFGQQMMELSQAMPSVAEVSFITNAQLNNQSAANADVIYIGKTADNPTLNQLTSIPFYFHDDQLMIDPLLKPYLAISQETPLVLDELIQSPFAPERKLLLILSNRTDQYDEGIDLFANPKKSQLTKGNVILSYQNGTFTSLQIDKIYGQIHFKRKVNFSIMVVGIGIIGIILLLWIFRKIYKRMKAYFTPKI